MYTELLEYLQQFLTWSSWALTKTHFCLCVPWRMAREQYCLAPEQPGRLNTKGCLQIIPNTILISQLHELPNIVHCSIISLFASQHIPYEKRRAAHCITTHPETSQTKSATQSSPFLPTPDSITEYSTYHRYVYSPQPNTNPAAMHTQQKWLL